jgi:exonuclease III
MKPKILSWNVRGLNEGNKRLRIRNLLKQWKADIICLKETKLEIIFNSLVRNLWSCPFEDWC